MDGHNVQLWGSSVKAALCEFGLRRPIVRQGVIVNVSVSFEPKMLKLRGTTVTKPVRRKALLQGRNHRYGRKSIVSTGNDCWKIVLQGKSLDLITAYVTG